MDSRRIVSARQGGTQIEPAASPFTRRQFLTGAAAFGGAAVLWAGQDRAFAQAAKGASASEAEMHALAATHPALHKIVSDALAHAKYSFSCAAMGIGGAGNDFSAASAKFIAARKPRTQAAYKKGIAQLMADNAARQEHFGRFTAIAPASFTAMSGSEALTKVGPAVQKGDKLDFEALNLLSLFGAPSTDLSDEQAAKAEEAAKEAAAKAKFAKDHEEGRKYKELEFFITEVLCIQNTGGLLEGTDEIAMGGAGVNASGHIAKVPQFHVRDGFDKDSSDNKKIYRGGRSFCRYFMDFNKPWPHAYTVTVAVAELDSGGFGDFLLDVWNKIKTVVIGAIADAAGTAIGSALGSIIPGLGTLIGAVVGAFIGWLVGLFHNDDDVVGCKSARLDLYNDTKSYYDAHRLETRAGIPVKLDFTDSGHYRVTGGWRLVPA